MACTKFFCASYFFIQFFEVKNEIFLYNDFNFLRNVNYKLQFNRFAEDCL